MPDVLEPGEQRPSSGEPKRFIKPQAEGDPLTKEQKGWLFDFDLAYERYYPRPSNDGTLIFIGEMELPFPLDSGGRCTNCVEAPEDHFIHGNKYVCRRR